MNKKNKKELMRFTCTGIASVCTDFIVYFILSVFLDTSIAKMISFVCGSIVAFIVNKFWTFEKKERSSKEVIKFIILYLCTSLINSVVNEVVLITITIKIVAFLCATGVSAILNFLGQKFFVFK